jgi:hypothetical protein
MKCSFFSKKKKRVYLGGKRKKRIEKTNKQTNKQTKRTISLLSTILFSLFFTSLLYVTNKKRRVLLTGVFRVMVKEAFIVFTL